MTVIRRVIGRAADRTDCGFSLIEALVAMVIFVTAMSVMTSVVAAMTTNMRQTEGVSLATDQARLAFQRLDKQVRYANGISEPGFGADNAYYVEVRFEDPKPNPSTSGRARKDESCRQWRVTRDGKLETRAWEERASGAATPFVIQPQPWVTVATGIINNLDVPAELPFSTMLGPNDLYRNISVNLRTQRSKKPLGRAQVKSVFYARNTLRSDPATGICDVRGRS